MPRIAALLRAVNLPSHQKVTSAELKSFATSLGFTEVQTLLASGNLVFGAPGAVAAIEKRLEAASAKQLGLATDYFVRTAHDFDAIVTGNPFPREAKDDPSHLVVLFLKTAPGAAAVKALRAAIVGRESVEASGRHVVAYYPDGIGESKLTNKVVEKHLGGACTGRNWNTLLKLHALTHA